MKEFESHMDVETIEDALAVINEMLKDLDKWGYLEAARNEKYGEQIHKALELVRAQIEFYEKGECWEGCIMRTLL